MGEEHKYKLRKIKPVTLTKAQKKNLSEDQIKEKQNSIYEERLKKQEQNQGHKELRKEYLTQYLKELQQVPKFIKQREEFKTQCAGLSWFIPSVARQLATNAMTFLWQPFNALQKTTINIQVTQLDPNLTLDEEVDFEVEDVIEASDTINKTKEEIKEPEKNSKKKKKKNITYSLVNLINNPLPAERKLDPTNPLHKIIMDHRSFINTLDTVVDEDHLKQHPTKVLKYYYYMMGIRETVEQESKTATKRFNLLPLRGHTVSNFIVDKNTIHYLLKKINKEEKNRRKR